jgi:cobalt/nickel transport system ATP-binding protein
VIDARELGFAYDGGRAVLQDLTFRIHEGNRAVLLGPNGCGKSTLLKILNGLLAPTAGAVSYEGERLEPATLKRAGFLRRFRRDVVLLFQNPDAMIFNPTVFDELAFGPRQLEMEGVEDRVRSWAARVGLAGHLARSPFGLSYGEKQKLCLAAILILEPRLVLLDEPTSNLDPRSAGWLVDFLRELPLTILVTTHHLDLVDQLGERILVLGEDGRLLHDGAHAELMGNRDLLERANLVAPVRARAPKTREIGG